MPTDKKKDAEKEEKEEVHYAAEEYAVNDYVAPAEYTVPQGYYNENGEYVEDNSNYYSNATGDAAQQGYDYSDPNNQYYADNGQYYYGYDYNTGAYTDPNNTAAAATDASAAYNYDQYYAQSYYDTSAATRSYGGSGVVPESVAALQSAATSNYGSNNASPAPKVYYPSTANSNNPVGPIIITKSGYTGPQTSTSSSSPAPTSSPANNKNDDADTKKKKKKSIVRAAGGEVWEDHSLEEWDDNDFRLFAGDLGNEVTEELLYKAFSKYPSLLRTRVVRDNRTMKSRGFGFISFKDPDDFVKAWREMNGKYVGNRPIKLRKSTWKERNIDVRAKKERDRVGPYPKHR
ncbi:unnamed protein product [Mucor circinelloides]|uniref:RRM domain-containing protein n=1 Tax=Mucor circinelloides f. circinelloides (strain 1006PhL) TaxID=1220926 RepID=S2J4F6_MUCC1|nr:hypothetical protein HMPREF1544_08230 [Mucor circinelloides 1006PhL]